MSAVLLGASLVTLAGCGSTEKATNLPVDERFKHAKALFDDENYLEAINEFTAITLQFPGSGYADGAQFYLGECRFMRHEFLLATFEYSLVKKNFPASPYVPKAQYKLALSYYYLSPRSNLDQEYTKKAIDEFQSFVEYYPADEHAVDAEEKIKELTTRLAKKQYDTARLYQTMEYYKAAIIYFDDVIEKYHDTEYAPPAYLGKVEVLITRRKFDDANTELNKFFQHYPNSVLRSQAERLKETIDQELKSSKQVTGTQSGRGEGATPDTGLMGKTQTEH
jgi:outer membrane protein assembly factor BamD